MDKVNKNDFIEIEFTGFANNDIFDTTNPEIAKKIGIDADVKPMIVSIGQGMVIQGLDEDLVDKEIEKNYKIHINSEKAFGKRNPSLIKTVPIRVFKEKNMNPYPGMAVQLDNYIAKILSVSGGRVIVDFNNPLAGKEIDYEFTIKRKVEDVKEKINSLQDFFFRQRFEFNIIDKKVIFKEQKIKPFLDIFSEKFKLLTGLEFIVEEKKEEKKENKEVKEKKIKEKTKEEK
jgi:FKBP-type peptidyl-prolyl cis-trans isomerase 2